MKHWRTFKPDIRLVDMVAEGASVNGAADLPLGKVAERYMGDADPATKARLRLILRYVNPKASLGSLTVKSANEITGRMRKDKKSEKQILSARGALVSAIYMAVHGKRRAVSYPRVAGGVDPHVVRLKIAEADISSLAQLLGPGINGRFGALLSDVKKAVQACPPKQFRIVYPAKTMLGDKKEINKVRSAVQDMLKKFHKGWIARWSSGEEVFYVVRQTDYEAALKQGSLT